MKGTKASAQEIRDLYEGLAQNYLTDFDVLLSGYAPTAAAVEAVGDIAQDLKCRAEPNPGSFFWGKQNFIISPIAKAKRTRAVLDPVMGDRGRLYVNEDVVPAYKNVVRHADLVLPNQFEAE